MNDNLLDLYALNQIGRQARQPIENIQNNIKHLRQHIRLHPEDAELYNAEIFIQLNELERLKRAEKACNRKAVLFGCVFLFFFILVCSHMFS